MRIEFLRLEQSRRRRDVKKFSFRISDLNSLEDFLETLLTEMSLMQIFTFTNTTMTGVEVYSNLIPDAAAAYVVFKPRDRLSNNDLIRELEKMTNSNKTFLDLNQPFEIVISVVNL